MKKARINCITRLRINMDGSGVRSVIFLQGCPLKCFWCCNPETRHGNNYQTITQDTLNLLIHHDSIYFQRGGGLVFSGGEPLSQSAFLEQFISSSCKNFTVDIETSLYAKRSAIDQLIPLIDCWNIDLKHMDDDLHRKYTGVSNKRIHRNLRYLVSKIGSERITITYPIIPGHNDSDENIQQMIRFMHELRLTRIRLHPYRTHAEKKHRALGLEFNTVTPLSNERFQQISCTFTQNGIIPHPRSGLFGKEKCNYLKKIRREVCQSNKIPLEIRDCEVTEGCIGTCPLCEHELKMINRFLDKKSSVIINDSGKESITHGKK